MIFEVGDLVEVIPECRSGFDDSWLDTMFPDAPKKRHSGEGVFEIIQLFWHNITDVEAEGCHPQCLIVSQGEFVSMPRSGLIFRKVIQGGPPPDTPPDAQNDLSLATGFFILKLRWTSLLVHRWAFWDAFLARFRVTLETPTTTTVGK